MVKKEKNKEKKESVKNSSKQEPKEDIFELGSRMGINKYHIDSVISFNKIDKSKKVTQKELKKLYENFMKIGR